MIDDPLLLTIRRKIDRPDRALVEAFAGTPTGFIVDAMAGRGALDWRIKPLPGAPARFVGSALPCLNGPADNLALCAAVLARLRAVRASEAKMLKAVQGGLKEPGFMAAILASDRVRYIDG